MDWHAVAGVVSGLIGVAALVPYIRDMVQGGTRPNIVSWLLWAGTVGISAAAQLVAEPSWSALMVVVTFVGDVTVLTLALVAYGYAVYRWWDVTCFILSIAALVLWYTSGDPLIALALAIAADGIAFIPTYIKSYREPHTETPVAWFVFTASGATALLAAPDLHFASIGFPLYYVFANGFLALLLTVRRHRKKA